MRPPIASWSSKKQLNDQAEADAKIIGDLQYALNEIIAVDTEAAEITRCALVGKP